MTVPSATRPASSSDFGPRTPTETGRHGCGRMIERDSAQPHIPALDADRLAGEQRADGRDRLLHPGAPVCDAGLAPT